uniref:Uncharacterized protein n=1 Tax=Gopherus agassizii TaxID=38772 RepID=A0A452GTF4_9SAUR
MGGLAGLWLKLFPHWAQWKGRSPVCSRRWVVSADLWLNRDDRWVNPLPHSLQALGRSPVWVRQCPLRMERRMNPFPHWGQTWGFSPVCTLMFGTDHTSLPKGSGLNPGVPFQSTPGCS